MADENSKNNNDGREIIFLVDRAEVRCKTGHSRARLLIYLASVLAVVTVNGVKKKE